jgi:YVTN family beta-propeller protein
MRGVRNRSPRWAAGSAGGRDRPRSGAEKPMRPHRAPHVSLGRRWVTLASVSAALLSACLLSAAALGASRAARIAIPRSHNAPGPLAPRIGAAEPGIPGAPFGFGSALLASAPVRPEPSAVAVDRTTNTIYVANGVNVSGPSTVTGDTVSVIDGRRCRASDVSRCKGPWPTVKVGDSPSTITVDQATDTVYVTILSNDTVAVFNGATCNGRVSSGCGQTAAHVPVGPAPFGILTDDANHTVYVGNPGMNFTEKTMSLINTLTCRGSDLAGCAAQKPPMVPVAVAPGDFDLNPITHTIYVAIIPGVAAFDADTCNATVMSGCGRIGILTDPPVNLTSGVTSAKVDSANNTIYVANANATISAFDGRACNADDLTGCAAEVPGVVTVAPPVFFANSWWLTVDAPLHTVYVVNQKNDNLAAVDTNVCSGSQLSACGTLTPPTIHTGSDPESVIVNPDTQTLYTANQIDNTVSVIDATRCNAATTTGCRHPAPAVSLFGPSAISADPAAQTTYVASGEHMVAMINTRACNVHSLEGCRQTPPAFTLAGYPHGITIDRRTHTVYVANGGPGDTGTVSVIDARTCNATDVTGCAHHRTLAVPGGTPGDIAVNSATDTIYVATIIHNGRYLVSVFNGATCNAETSGGCDQTPASLALGATDAGFPAVTLAVNPATNTLYAANNIYPPNGPQIGDRVYVINGATCDATNTGGCSQTPTTVTVGPNPNGIAVDPATNTIYTANLADGELAGSVSVISGATCNGSDTTGCGDATHTVAAGFGSNGISVDPRTHRVYVTNIEDTSVSLIDGATCNSQTTRGCGQNAPKIAVGSYPSGTALDPAVGTAYVTNGDNTISVIPLTP